MTRTLMTVTEVAAYLGVKRNTLTAWKTRGKMPKPDAQYGRTPVWAKDTIDEWRTTSFGMKQPLRYISKIQLPDLPVGQDNQ